MIGRRWTRTAAVLIVLTLASSSLAHVVDEYLQATIVSIQPGGFRLRMNLTPGTEVAGKVIPAIDRNGDGTLQPDETTEYAQQVRRDLTVRLDGRELQVRLQESEFPQPDEMRTGWGTIKLDFFAAQPLSTGTHRLTMENRHMPAIGVYLFNAGFPESKTIRVLGQKRNANQSQGEIEFSYQPVKVRSSRWWSYAIAGSIVLLELARRTWPRWVGNS